MVVAAALRGVVEAEVWALVTAASQVQEGVVEAWVEVAWAAAAWAAAAMVAVERAAAESWVAPAQLQSPAPRHPFLRPKPIRPC